MHKFDTRRDDFAHDVYIPTKRKRIRGIPCAMQVHYSYLQQKLGSAIVANWHNREHLSYVHMLMCSGRREHNNMWNYNKQDLVASSTKERENIAQKNNCWKEYLMWPQTGHLTPGTFFSTLPHLWHTYSSSWHQSTPCLTASNASPNSRAWAASAFPCIEKGSIYSIW